jgi:DNA transformation protein and related proteins
MPITAGYLGYVLDQMSGLSEVVAKRTFGGVGLYFGDAIFALIEGEAVYLHVDELTRPEFVAQGMPQFSPTQTKPDKITSNFYQVPEDVLGDAAQLTVWARRAVRAALAGSRKRRPRRSTPSSKPRAG